VIDVLVLIQLKSYWDCNMRNLILVLFSVVFYSSSFAKDIYQEIYNLDKSYYGDDFPTAKHISYPEKNLSIDISYHINGYEHFDGYEHTVYKKSILIKVNEISKEIIFDDVTYKNIKNYLTLCKMNDQSNLLSHTEVFEGADLREPWIGFNINFYKIRKYSGKEIIEKLPENIQTEFNMDNKFWTPTVESNKPDDGRKFYPFYDEKSTLNRLIEMGLCASIDSPSNLEKALKDNQNISIDKLYVDNQILLYPLDKNTVTSYNNNAFYLGKENRYDVAIYILNKVIDKYPNRMVAYINLGDLHWDNGSKKEAVKIYQDYIQKMNALGKEGKIPEKILKRVDSFLN
jgi:hypothetical protein